MKHEVTHKQNLSGHDWGIVVKLIPETLEEENAIKNFEVIGNYSDDSMEMLLVGNYLLFKITGYSVLKLISKNGTSFILKVSEKN